MQDIISTVLAEDAVAADFAALSVPESYRGAVILKEESEMSQGMATKDKDPQKSLHIREVRTPNRARARR
ncbi:Crotonyl-CoA reductase OS=Streptomyces antimycoticus OX=68175 GN=SANT12839_085540 PE=4 SV=1 [Streptomyces antimycoticus]